MRRSALIAAAGSLFLCSVPAAQPHGPTIASARAGFFVPSTPIDAAAQPLPLAECGSTLRNAALLGLGLSLATAILELTYTIVREPFVRNGVDLPAADPRLIAAAGGVGFLVGVIGTERCRRRR